MTYRRRRLLSAGLVTGGVLLIALILRLWGLDPDESWAVVLGAFVLATGALLGVTGGIGAAILASAGYLSLRLGALHALRGEAHTALLARAVTWVAIYVVVAVGSGLAAGAFAPVLSHLERFDEVDAATEFGNARKFLRLTGDGAGSELARLRRTGAWFSVLSCILPVGKVDLKAIAAGIREALPRSTDHPCHAVAADGRHLVAVVLANTPSPSTPPGWQDVLRGRLEPLLAGGTCEIVTVTASPKTGGHIARNLEALTAIRAEFEAVDRREHPA